MRDAPPITERMRADARGNPGSWLYILDPAYPLDGEPPPEYAYLGAYPVNGDGEIVNEFRPNATYRRTAEPAGVWTLPEAAEPPGAATRLSGADELRSAPPRASDADRTETLEAMLTRINDGELPPTALLAAVLDAPLLVYGRDGEDTAVFGFPERNSGAVMVCACTSPEHVPAAWPCSRTVRGRELADYLYDGPLMINPAGPVCAIVDGASLRAVIT
jgi:hypothetical protein